MELLSNLSGNMTITNAVFLIAGVFVSLYLETRGRDIKSKRTPEKFSFKFLAKDNALRLATSLALAFIGFKFSNEMFGVAGSDFTAFTIGVTFDKVIESIKIKKYSQDGQV
jgi:hypothetical protein